ncbi:MAG: FAD-binding oxidoreductase [Spirochaetales bacterium]|nr:FAD-binding oxidoreductase [Spirochaetales bacterium]
MVTIIPQKDISPEYLTDESRYQGRADSLSFPETEAELVETVGRLAASAVPFTVQGARTGITGGAVPEGGHILNLSRMKRITGFACDETAGRFSISIEPGLTLAELGGHLRRKDFGPGLAAPASQRAFERFRNSGRHFFPPDPTETTASLGGMVSCNASGARSHLYGPTRNYVTGLTVVLSSGKIVRLARGRSLARGRDFTLELDGAAAVTGKLPGYTFRAVKNAAGYRIRDDMDLIDLFIGQEGTLGVVSSMTLGLLPEPAHTMGVLFFFTTEEQALDFVLRVRADEAGGSAVRPSAVEYFDRGALAVTAEITHEAIRTPDPAHRAGVYVEVDAAEDDGEERLYSYFEGLSGLVALSGGDPEANWAGDGAAERESLRLFRHAVPEAVNARIAAARRETPGITKLGTDFAVGNDALGALVKLYRDRLGGAGLSSVMFGHIGDNHLHVNVLPRTEAEYEAGKKVFAGIAEAVVGMGGTVSGEHGIGKLKRDLLSLMYGPEDIDDMKRLKRTFDPGFLLNRGNLFTIP